MNAIGPSDNYTVPKVRMATSTRMILAQLFLFTVLMSPFPAVAQSLSFSPNALSFATQVVGKDQRRPKHCSNEYRRRRCHNCKCDCQR
jgi:hypothetical protein